MPPALLLISYPFNQLPMTQKRKAAMLLPEACPNAEDTFPTFPLPAQVEPLYRATEMLEFVNKLTQEKGLTPQRESFIKLNAMSANSKNSPQKSVPWLSLHGIWLQNAGFVKYEYAKTIAFNGMLIVIPGLNPPPFTCRDFQNFTAFYNKFTRYVHTQK
jgi:hypothetical protein